MKKILYSLLFAFIFFIGTNEINAGFQCYYKTDDGKIDMYVYFDGKKAYETLMKGYSESDGFAEDQKRFADLTINLTSEFSSCPSTLKYTIKPGIRANKYEFTNNTNIDTSGENEYKLSNYDFDKVASVCKYETKHTNTIINTSLTIKGYEDSFVYFFGDEKLIEDSINPYGGVEWQIDQNKINTFIEQLNENGECPQLSANELGSGTYQIYVSPGYPINVVETLEDIKEIEENKILLECAYDFNGNNYMPEPFVIYFKKNSLTGIQLCVGAQIEDANSQLEYHESCGTDIVVHSYGNRSYYFEYDEENNSKDFYYSQLNNNKCPDMKDVILNIRDEQGGGTTIYVSTENFNNGDESTGTTGDLKDQLTGEYFEKSMKELLPYLEALANKKNISITSEDKEKLKINIKGKIYTNFPWFATEQLDSNISIDQLENDATEIIRNTRDYCKKYVFDRYKVEASTSMEERVDECESFYAMVVAAGELGLLKNITSECSMLSSDFTIILKEILNLIKIAGPILALGLGTVDFIKAMSSGDADKEMKTAWKRFTTRLIAAILLFLIPIILAFILDRFLGNTPGNGYNPDNPFCIDTGMNE